MTYNMNRFVKPTNLFQTFEHCVCNSSICYLLSVENYLYWCKYIFIWRVMLFSIIDDIFDMSEFRWAFFPVPKEIINKFGLSRRYFNPTFTFIGRRYLEYNWIINVLLYGGTELLEIHQLVYKYHVELYILKVLVNDCLRFTCFESCCIYTLLQVDGEIWCFLAQIVSMYI